VKRLRLMPQRSARQSPAPGVRSSSTDGPRRQYRLHCAVAGSPTPPCPAPPSACLCRQARSMGSTRCVRRQHTSEERLSRPVRYSHRLKQTEQRLSGYVTCRFAEPFIGPYSLAVLPVLSRGGSDLASPWQRSAADYILRSNPR
jgi:hypothetical protein